MRRKTNPMEFSYIGTQVPCVHTQFHRFALVSEYLFLRVRGTITCVWAHTNTNGKQVKMQVVVLTLHWYTHATLSEQTLKSSSLDRQRGKLYSLSFEESA